MQREILRKVRSLSKVQNFIDVPSDLPFSETFNSLWRTKIQSTARVEFPVNTVCYLAKVEKIRIDAATSCQDREFSIPLQAAPSKSIGLSFPQKVLGFREERKPRAFWNYVRNIQFNRPLLDPFTKIFFDLQLVAASHLFSQAESRLVTSFRSLDFKSLIRWASFPCLNSSLNQR